MIAITIIAIKIAPLTPTPTPIGIARLLFSWACVGGFVDVMGSGEVLVSVASLSFETGVDEGVLSSACEGVFVGVLVSGEVVVSGASLEEEVDEVASVLDGDGEA
jgi:hypothetical protein